MFEIFSHRGGLADPNTLKQFKISADVGADGIECDLCLSKDGEPIIYHPGPEPIQSWEEAKKSGILHFEQLLNFLSKYPNLKCLLDIKQNSKPLVELAVSKISKTEFLKTIFLTASKSKVKIVGLEVGSDMLTYAKLIDPNIKIHVIDPFPFNIYNTAKNLKADMVSFGWLVDSKLSQYLFKFIFQTGFRNTRKEIEKAQSAGALVMGGIANDEKEVKILVAPQGICTGINAIITDFPINIMIIRQNIEKIIKSPCL